MENQILKIIFENNNFEINYKINTTADSDSKFQINSFKVSNYLKKNYLSSLINHAYIYIYIVSWYNLIEMLGVNALSEGLLSALNLVVPGNISLSVAIAGPVTLTPARPPTPSHYYTATVCIECPSISLKFRWIVCLCPQGVLRTHARTSTRTRMRTRRVESALASTHNTGEEEKAHARGKKWRMRRKRRR